MKYNGKCESEALTCFISFNLLLISENSSYSFEIISSLLQEIIYYIVCMGGIDENSVDMCEKIYFVVKNISNRNKLALDIFEREKIT
jgi:hypothetical protein